MSGAKVGHIHTKVTRKDGQIYWNSQQSITTLRAGQPLEQRISLESWEDERGRVSKWRWRMNSSGQIRGWTGIATKDGFAATAESGERHLLQSAADCRGFFAEQQAITEIPLGPGSRLEFPSLVPLVNEVGGVTMKVVGEEEVETALGPQKLHRIESKLQLSSAAIDSVYWVDDSRRIVKQWVRQGNHTMERTAREIALAPNDEFDLYDAINVPVDRRIEQMHGKQRATYRLRRASGEPIADAFVDDASQRVTPLANGQVEIVVRRWTPGAAADADFAAVRSAPRPTEKDLRANSLIEVDAAIIQQLAQSVLPESDDDWEIARALEAAVHGKIRRKNLSQGFNSAATTARLLEGDCTEHSVLLAAVCRARGIPCRVAVGLVYARDLMAYHMWNEVWIEDRWVPLDATLGRGAVGPGHIKVRLTDLDGVAPFAAFIPVLELMGDLEIEIVDVQ